MYRVFGCFSSPFCYFQKESFVNRLFFDPRLVVDSASRGRCSKNHRFPLNSFWKSTIFDAGSTRRSRGCIFSQDPFKISLNFLKDFKRISWVFQWFCDPRLLRGRADERPGIDRNYRFTKDSFWKLGKSRLKSRQNAIHSNNGQQKRDTFDKNNSADIILHHKIAKTVENRKTYRVSWGSRCQTRCKIAIFERKSTNVSRELGVAVRNTV